MTDTPSTAQYLTREQVHALIDAAKPGRDRLFIRVAWETGARVSEIVTLRYLNVMAEEKLLLLGVGKTARFVPISDSLVVDVEIQSHSELVFDFNRQSGF